MYLLNGICYTHCPVTYFPANITSVSLTSGLPVTVVGVCSRCDSAGVCASLLRIVLTVTGTVVCAAVLMVLVVCACLRGVCRRQRQTKVSMESIAAARLHSPRYITNGHILAGLSSRPLLAASDSDSSADEGEAQSEPGIMKNI